MRTAGRTSRITAAAIVGAAFVACAGESELAVVADRPAALERWTMR